MFLLVKKLHCESTPIQMHVLFSYGKKNSEHCSYARLIPVVLGVLQCQLIKFLHSILILY